MRVRLLALGLLGLARSGSAQDVSTRALELERRGDFGGAASAWRTVLTAKPSDLAALLGLERALTPLGRLGEMTAQVQAAAHQDPSPGVFGVAIRVWSAARQPDSARAAVERWSTLEPGSELPFQEWGMAAYAARDRASAKAAYLLGRQRLGRPDAMAAEVGQLAVLDGDYPTAAREWIGAIKRVPGYRSSAVAMLARVPPAGRPVLLRELERSGEFDGVQLAATLEVRWGAPLQGVRRLVAGLPSGGSGTVPALQDLLEELRGSTGGDQATARAVALEELALRTEGPQRARIRLDAAQAYAEGGDQAAARRMLTALGSDSTATPLMAATATSTLVEVLIDEGGIEEADRRFRQLAPLLGAEDRDRLAIRLAQGWLHTGRLGRADTLLGADSSMEAQAVRGRAALYRGDLAMARAQLREAGPFTGDRGSATERLAILGLLQILDADSMPELGAALFRLERRDSTGAAAALERLAPGLPADHGGAELLLLAGKLRGMTGDAERLFRAVVAEGIAASSPAAEYALADLLIRSGRTGEAIPALEHLLVTWPGSAVVPQARRLLDVARGAVPTT